MRWVRDELEACSFIDAKSELTDPLVYEDGSNRSGERAGLAEWTGGSVRMRSPRPGREISRRGEGNPAQKRSVGYRPW